MKAKQKGAVLIIIAFIVGLAATAYFVTSFSVISNQTNQAKKTYQALNEAKQALIGYAISHPNFPGQLPFPDRNSDSNYDGYSDCNSPTSSFSYELLIGQLPILGQTNPCIAPQTGLGSDFKDVDGNRLWYALSRNLVHKYESSAILPVDPVINPSIIMSPVYPWLRVFDASGRLLSDRVAAVIIAPHNLIGSQNRASNTPAATEFLDALSIDGVAYSNADYNSPDEDFIAAPDSRNVTATDTVYEKPYYFNDKLIYITIDELIEATARRAGAEAKHLLNEYQLRTLQYPYAANLASILNNHVSTGINQTGMLPIDVTDTCVCADAQSCSCSFNLIKSVTFTRGSSTPFTSSTSCTMSGAACTCSGAGSCLSGARNFTCTSAGVCTHDINGAANRYDFTAHDHLDIPVPPIPSASGGCSAIYNKARCNGMGSFNIGLKESPWFKTNFWQDYFYYQWSAIPNLQVGGKTGISALIIGTGQTIVSEVGITQNRPSSSILDYLDSTENTNGNNVFDGPNKQHNNNYNDQPLIVEPK